MPNLRNRIEVKRQRKSRIVARLKGRGNNVCPVCGTKLFKEKSK